MTKKIMFFLLLHSTTNFFFVLNPYILLQHLVAYIYAVKRATPLLLDRRFAPLLVFVKLDFLAREDKFYMLFVGRRQLFKPPRKDIG
tara:strand:+ start:637 stop:897 length:261 start_codon:yes stop_codon:yes gene_type:complete